MIRITDSQDDMERMLIGSLLADPDKFLDVAPLVGERDFQTGYCRQAFVTIGKLYRSGAHVDLPSVALAMGKQEHLMWLSDCELIHGHNAVRFANDLGQRGIIRRIQARAKALAGTTVWEGSDEIASALRLMYLEEAITGGGQDGSIASTDKAFDAKQEEYRKRGCIGYGTGFDAYEQNQVYYVPGHMWMVGGWTSTGKTAFVIEKLRRLCWDQDSVGAYFSTEMTREEFYARYLANITGYGSNLILSGRLVGRAAETVEAARKRIVEKGNLYIYDKPRTVDEVELECKKIAMRHGALNVFFVDFVQNLTGAGKSRREMFADMARRLQDLPKDVEGTGIYLSQVSNDVGRNDPGQLEFKEAGEFAAACDKGIQLKRAKEDPKIMLVDVRKNRQGPVFKFNVRFSEHWNRIEEG